MTSNPTANKRKGARWELDIEAGFRKHGLDIERLRLAGMLDEGDHYIRHTAQDYTVVEAKSGAFAPAHWDEAVREAANFAAKRGIDPDFVEPVVIVKRRGKPFEEAFVVTSVQAYFGLEVPE